MRRVGLVQACDDPQLLGFAAATWPRQRERLAAVERGPRMHVWADGRRSLKTTRMALVGLWCCLLRPELLDRLRPRERGYAVGVATNLRQARLLVRTALSIVERSPLLSRLVEAASEDEIRFANGTGFAAFPCTSRGGRGWPVFALLMDEAAHFISETEGPQVAERVFASLAPSTAQFGDLARIVVSSTPFGQDGFFAETHQRAASGELADAVAYRATSAEMNPTLDRAFLDRERARDPETFRSEYEAEFVGGGAAFLDPDRIADAVADRGELSPAQAVSWVAGLDPAFSSDPFGLALVGRAPLDPAQVPVGAEVPPHRLVLGLARAWKPARRKAGSFEERRAVEDATLAEVADVCRRYRATAVMDSFAAAPAVLDRLQRAGVTVRMVPMSAHTKSAVYAELRARLNAGSLALYEHIDLLAELRRLRTRYAAGSASVVNPRVGGSHGDMAQSLALAVFEQDRWGMGPGGDAHAGGEASIAADLGVSSWDGSGRIDQGVHAGMAF